MKLHLRAPIGLLAAVSVLSGCPMSMSAPEHDAGPGIDAPTLRADAPAMMGSDAPVMMGSDAPPMTDPDAGAMTDPDAPIARIDAGGGGTDAGMTMTGVDCGGDTCLDPEICCVTFAGGAAAMTCSAPEDCMGVAASCDGPEDCAGGEVCCATRSGPGGGGGTTMCVDTMDCRFGRLCHEDADCGMGDTCCSFMGASVCSPFCP